MSLEQLAVGIGDDIAKLAQQPEFQEEFRENIFTSMILNELSELGVVESPRVCYAEKRIRNATARLNGYAIPESADRLDLVVTIFSEDGTRAVVETSREQASKAIEAGWRFFDAVAGGRLTKVEPATDEYEMVQSIEALRGVIDAPRIILLTNTKVALVDRVAQVAADDHPGLSVEVWDLERLNRARESGVAFDVIDVDFERDAGAALPCLPLPEGEQRCEGYLAIVPGAALYRIYDRFGDRLLELNVRCFLQARGKVNRGIRDTLLSEPENFFAYNNGLSIVAEEVRLSADRTRILGARGLQIVNGGQTTASIHRAGKKDGADLSRVFVQAKISVVPSSQLEEMVPLISKNANSQNKVNDADFSANDRLHRSIEERSRTTWAPGERLKWFYERARGQYQEARRRASASPTLQKKFDAEFPAANVFTKTDLAASENTWCGHPDLVSMGGQKNFIRFMEERGRDVEVGLDEFTDIVARLITYRSAQRVIRDEAFPAYRANIVTYSLAYIVNRLGDRLDLGRIWREQAIPSQLTETIRTVSRVVARQIKESSGDLNVTEWCKKSACWEQIRDLSIPLPSNVWSASARQASDIATPSQLFAELARQQIDVVSEPNGSVWVVGSGGIAARVKSVAARGGFSLQFRKAGSAVTGGKPAWLLTPSTCVMAD